jgi:parvulin-like peptidyl-prolyl isomerase
LKAGDSVSCLNSDQVDLLARHHLLRPLLRQLVIAELTADVPIAANDAVDALEAFKRDHNIESEQQLETFLRTQLLQRAELEQQLLQPKRVQRYVAEHYRPKAEARFLQRKTQLDRVVFSLLRLADPGLAQELFQRIEEGEADFAALAAHYAQGPERATRGVVGPIPLVQAHPLLAERLRTSQPGVLIEPFALETWWLVVRLESVIPASLDEATAQTMTRELFDEAVEQAVQQRLESLIPLRFPEA